MDSRRARRMMKQMGMNMDELGDIKRVILQGDNKEIVIEGPQVTSINVQGTKMYQVAGGRETERKIQAAGAVEAAPVEEEPLVLPEEDILLVAQQANVSIEKARVALENSDGDLAQAIIKLQTR
ncbi:nascent polypeptide-associated complex protein [Candidatus Bathyarchaeota archaeon]|nr:MAG: nascent polypeptide-associated complex protein [Candidatus Bathyarchaeota archaeon]